MADWYGGVTAVDGVVWTVVVFALWVGYRWIASLRYLLAAAYQEVLFVPFDVDQVPEHVRVGLQGPVDELRGLGFTLLRWVGVRRMLVGERPLVFQAVLRHQESGTHCMLGFNRFPEPLVPLSITLRTWLEDGSSVVTLRGAGHIAVDPGTRTYIQDPETNTPEELWKLHISALQDRAATTGAVQLDEWAFFRSQEAEVRTYLFRMRQQRTLVPAPSGDDRLVLGWRAAVIGTFKRARLRRKSKDRERHHTNAYRKAETKLPEVPIEEEVGAFLDLEWVHCQPSRRLFHLGAFLITLVLFAVTALQIVPPYTALLLCVVVGVHELGHWAAMKLLGYRDASIFFVPLLGAVTTGSKDDPGLSEDMLILLAGPLPGLVMAAVFIGFAGIPDDRWFAEPLLLLLMLNAANILPLFPLDGGRIVQALLFSRRPYAESAFKGLTVFALWSWAVLSLVFGLPLIAGVAGVLGFAVATRLPTRWRLARLQRRLLDECSVEQQGDIAANGSLVRIFAVIRETHPRSLSFLEKVRLARTLEESVNAPRSPGLRDTIAWLSAYLVVLGMAVLLVAFFVTRHLSFPTAP